MKKLVGHGLASERRMPPSVEARAIATLRSSAVPGGDRRPLRRLPVAASAAAATVIAMRIAAVIAAVLLLAGCSMGKHTTSTVTVTVQKPAPKPTLGVQDAGYFGQPVSVTKVDAKRYLLVVKPMLFLVGVTANVAFARQQGTSCQPLACPGVEDDRLVVPAGSQELTFVLPAATTGTVINGKMHPTRITAAQLAGLVAGAKTPHLIEPLVSGLWLAVNVDKITSFAQQFQP
jgi:hypothetical protein